MLHRFFNQQLARAISEKNHRDHLRDRLARWIADAGRDHGQRHAALGERGIHTVAGSPARQTGGRHRRVGLDDIYMHPEARIGDAAPIEMKEGGGFRAGSRKGLSYTREVLRTLAEKKGGPPGLAEAMADKDLKVFRVVNPQTGEIQFKTEAELHAAKQEFGDRQLVAETREDNLLTVNGRQAHELQLAEPPVSGMEELKQDWAFPGPWSCVPSNGPGSTTSPRCSAVGSAFMLFFFGRS
ncbi:MAG: hypothetical protein Ct9H300mP1_28370 [Planctomycetaceae bacterium]|nr:MAG: hypothetical protein Ct9H300mP1_28370 [Planctomycetaceae bacterium]